MGRRGPAPEPAQVRIRKGETRPSQVNYEEPVPLHREPTMPTNLDPDARPIWRRVMRDMKGAGVIFSADTGVLRAYCEAEASYVRNIIRLGETGPVIRGARGREVVVNPLARIVREDREAVRLLARELGLSPAARAGLRMDMGAPLGDLDAVLGPHPRLRALG